MFAFFELYFTILIEPLTLQGEFMLIDFSRVKRVRIIDSNKKRKQPLVHPQWVTDILQSQSESPCVLNEYAGRGVINITKNGKSIAKMFYLRKTDACSILTFRVQNGAVQYLIDCER